MHPPKVLYAEIRGLSLSFRMLMLRSDSTSQVSLRAARLLAIQTPLFQGANKSPLESHAEATLATPRWTCRYWSARQQLTHRERSPACLNLGPSVTRHSGDSCHVVSLQWQNQMKKLVVSDWQLYLPSRKKITSKRTWFSIRAEHRGQAKNVSKLPEHREVF